MANAGENRQKTNRVLNLVCNLTSPITLSAHHIFLPLFTYYLFLNKKNIFTFWIGESKKLFWKANSIDLGSTHFTVP